MRILWLTTRLPYPAHSGGNLVVYPRLRAMVQRGHEVHLAAPLEGGDTVAEALAHLRTICASVTVWPRRRPSSVAAIPSLLSLPWSSFARLPPPHVLARLRALARDCDIVQVEHTLMWPIAERVLPANGNTPAVLTLHADAAAGFARLAGTRPAYHPLHAGLRLEALRCTRTERRVLQDPRLDAVLFVSSDELRRTRRTSRQQSARFEHLPIGYPVRPPRKHSAAGEQTILLVASFLDPGSR